MQIQKGYRVIFQTYDQSNPKELLNEVCVLESPLEAPTNCLNFSIGIKNQIKLIQEVQNNVLNEKAKILEEGKAGRCPNCPGKLVKGGKQVTTFHDVFTDHRGAIPNMASHSRTNNFYIGFAVILNQKLLSL